MGDERLSVIAHELLEQLRLNATVDWRQRESARARMRILVKRIRKRYDYRLTLRMRRCRRCSRRRKSCSASFSEGLEAPTIFTQNGLSQYAWGSLWGSY
jgi:hypothetical protein